jgi:hypothetical protein
VYVQALAAAALDWNIPLPVRWLRILRLVNGNHAAAVLISGEAPTTEDRYGGGDVSAAVPAHIPVYGFNLVGYARRAMPAGHGNRHEMGGLTDRSFAQIVYIERGAKADWPWLARQAA